MKAERQLHDAGRIAVGVAALFVVLGCGVGLPASSPPSEAAAASSVATPSPAAWASPTVWRGCGSATISIDYLPFTTASLAGYGWDFVVADVVGFEAAIFGTRDGRPPPGFPGRPTGTHPDDNLVTPIYTPVNVVIDRAISGSWSPGPGQFLVEGGTVPLESGPVPCYEWRVSPAPDLTPGSRYVLVVSEALDDNGRNPLPLHKARFAWPVDATGGVTTPDGPMSIDKLAKVVVEATSPTR
jgi:hypothetical protein